MMVPCYHCGLDVAEHAKVTAEIGQELRDFCCTGCQSVCESIYAAGLAHFYQKSPEGTTLTPPHPTSEQSIAAYDLEQVQNDYVIEDHDQRTVVLSVDDIHCAACVWLIEQALTELEGVASVHVNLTRKQVTVVWLHNKIKLSTILARLQQLGYTATPLDKVSKTRMSDDKHKSMLYRLAIAGFAMMNMLWVSIALYSGADQGEFKQWFYWISFCIATPTYLYAAYPFLKQAYIGIKYRTLTMDLPIALGATVTYGYSCYVLFSQNQTGHLYFDTVVNFIFVILLGRYLESAARQKALRQSYRLTSLQPNYACIVTEGNTELVPIKAVQVGDDVLVKPGDRIPVDGHVIAGSSTVEEALLTGESHPLLKQQGDKVKAGCLNLDGSLTIKTEQVLSTTLLAQITSLIDKAQTSKTSIQTMTDKIVPWFIFVTLCLATVSFLYWYQYDTETAILTAASVLIITCPCALGLATPLSIAVAMGAAAKKGVILKSGKALEALASIKHIFLDKTGTLTEGVLTIKTIIPSENNDENTLLQLAASLEQYAEHVIAKAIVKAAKDRQLTLLETTDFKAYPGQGVSATVQDKTCLIGTEAFLQAQNIKVAQNWLAISEKCEQAGISTVFIVEQNQVSGMMGLEDNVRQDATSAIKALQQQGASLSIISGDKLRVVQSVAATLGRLTVHAEALPKDKVEMIKHSQHNDHKVAMVGDGINDAPALAQADVSMAFASGSDVTVNTADMVITGQQLIPIVDMMQLANKTQTIIKQNIAMSLVYNAVMVPLAMMAYINPLLAAVTMPISSLCVIANSARLNHVDKP